jgi:hypothetical protein
MLAQFDVERTVVDGAVERLQVVPYDAVERRPLRPAAFILASVGSPGFTHRIVLREGRATSGAGPFEERGGFAVVPADFRLPPDAAAIGFSGARAIGDGGRGAAASRGCANAHPT